MVLLTTCQALQYAVNPETSKEFERLSKEFSRDGRTSELEESRTHFYGGLLTIVLGGMGMMTDDPKKIAPLVMMAGSVLLGSGSIGLYYAARRIQGIWELARITAPNNERRWT